MFRTESAVGKIELQSEKLAGRFAEVVELSRGRVCGCASWPRYSAETRPVLSAFPLFVPSLSW